MKKKGFIIVCIGLIVMAACGLYFNNSKHESSHLFFKGDASKVFPQDQERKNTYIIGVSQLPMTMQPYLQLTEGSRVVNDFVFPSLAKKTEGDYQYQLAKSIVFQDESNSARIKIDSSVAFSDGCKLSAEDILYSFMFFNHKNIAYDNKAIYSCIRGMSEYQTGSTNEISGITKISDQEIQIDFINKSWEIFQVFETPILHPKDHDYSVLNMRKTHLGAGVYQLDKHILYQEMTLTKNTHSHQKAPYKTIRIIPADFNLLESQHIDTMIISQTQLDAVKELGGYQISLQGMNEQDFILCNLNNEEMADVKKRREIIESVDAKALFKTAYETGQLSKGLLSSEKESPNYQSLAKHKQHSLNKSIIFQFGYQATEQGLYEALNSQLMKVGLNVEGRKTPNNSSIIEETDVSLYYYYGQIEDLLNNWDLSEFYMQLDGKSLLEAGDLLEKYLVDEAYGIPLHYENYYIAHLCNKKDLGVFNDIN
ncbi:ABC transporter substrate-binding protein [Beduini massiliensis]|uniref:ABC transporter substrate-binding protein n=1 Tax=Beduini massiliensis TaxID=1585974 RepID=UPI00059A8580|nr:ABC transporter substrate-binding protein [Beduini massiliensis]